MREKYGEEEDRSNFNSDVQNALIVVEEALQKCKEKLLVMW